MDEPTLAPDAFKPALPHGAIVPVELQQLILHSVPAAGLRRAAEVCRSWFNICYPRLYHCVELKGTCAPPDDSAVHDKTFDDHARTLGKLAYIPMYVNTLRLRSAKRKEVEPSSDEAAQRDTRASLTMCSLRHLLCALPNVHTLDIQEVDWSECLQRHSCSDTYQNRAYKVIHVEDIQHFTENTHVLQCLMLATTIENVVVTGPVDGKFTPKSFARRVRIAHVQGSMGILQTISVLHLLQEVAAAGMESLHVDDITATEFVNISKVLQQQGATMRHLSIAFTCPDVVPPVRLWNSIQLHRCVQLQQLTLTTVPLIDQGAYAKRVQAVLLYLIHTAPPTVHTITLALLVVQVEDATPNALFSAPYWDMLRTIITKRATIKSLNIKIYAQLHAVVEDVHTVVVPAEAVRAFHEVLPHGRSGHPLDTSFSVEDSLACIDDGLL
ncbi:hypothetical protein NM688_g3998 [Phlebia brevispora]|uniref:Uncharacterized protein n=1 Tax=Phlebia brevispora TaxID=194682 RepID=A0ACC1T4D3_9APHY|nr:hypothetical protein NM688_g3998 [Phlebia brevispora]